MSQSGVRKKMPDSDFNTQGLTRRLGVLDIGSNSVRLVIYELYGAHFTPIYNEKILAGLGRDLNQTGKLSETGKATALAALKRFKHIAESQKLSSMLIGATAALRVASDAPDFIETVKNETGFDINPVSGKEEARLTAMGLIAAQPRAQGLAADLGGASLELVGVQNNKAQTGASLPLGPFEVIGKNLSGFIDYDDEALHKTVSEHLDEIDLKKFEGQALYLIGGAWRNLASVHQEKMNYPLRILQSYELSTSDAITLAQWAYKDGRESVLNWPGMRSRRAETLPYCGYLLSRLIEYLKPKNIIISQTGLREGLIYDSLSPALKNRNSLFDGCRDLARGNLQAVHFGEPLYKFLENSAEIFPVSFDRDNENRLRKAACFLAGFGKGFHPDYRAALVFDDVLYAPIAALTHKERIYLALILYRSYTSKSLSESRQKIVNLLSETEQRTARIYGTAMRVGIVASGRSVDLLPAMTLDIHDGRISLKFAPEFSALYSSRVKYRLKKLAQIGGYDLA